MADEQNQTPEEQEPLVRFAGTSNMLGRRRAYFDAETIDAGNVVQAIRDTISTHQANCIQMKYLWRYYRGDQPILRREKQVRPEICNKVVENHAQEVVSFKVGYQLSEPIQYICRNSEDEDSKTKEIAALNTLMFAEDKDASDRDLFEWMCIEGWGYRFIESDGTDAESHLDDSINTPGAAPFNLHVPEPWCAYIIYSNRYHKRPLAGVWVGEAGNESKVYTVYTPSQVFTIREDKLVNVEINGIGRIPIIEYDLNNARMGVFEAALPILDAINNVVSNRLDGIEQVVQALYLFKNCQVDQETFLAMLDLGAVNVKSVDGGQGDVELITNDLDQTQTQVAKDDLYNALINICGMPNRNTGGANDTGSAVLLRDGWTLAESHAKSYELQFKKAEREMLRVVLDICAASDEPVNLTLRDIDLAFNRRNYDNILTKAQTFTTLVQTGKVALQDCYSVSGLFTDPSAAAIRGMAYAEEQQQKAQELVAQQPSQQYENGGGAEAE